MENPITTLALGSSILMFVLAAVEQGAHSSYKVGALYVCFALTNSVALWLGK